jgi:hypothetical protein
MLIVFEVALAVSVILVARLGPYLYAAGAAEVPAVVPALAPEAGQ